MAIFEQEQLREGFTAWKFIYNENGFYFHSRKHLIESIDHEPHNHPFFLKSRILRGEYVELEYIIQKDGNWATIRHHRTEDDTPHIIGPDTIHKIISLPCGPVVTEAVPWGEHQPEYAWRFDSNGIFRRLKGETDFKQYKP